MTFSLEKTDKILLQLSEQADKNNVACKICWLPFTPEKRAPITLQCGHTICRMCIGILGKGLKHVPCGVCRERTFIEYKKLAKNIELSRLLEKFGHLTKDPEDEPVLVEPKDQLRNYYGKRYGYQFQTTAVSQQPSTSTQNEFDYVIERVEQILHHLREAIETIRSQGDMLQVYMIESQENHSVLGLNHQIQTRIIPAFAFLRQLLIHPIRQEMEKMIIRYRREAVREEAKHMRIQDPSYGEYVEDEWPRNRDKKLLVEENAKNYTKICHQYATRQSILMNSVAAAACNTSKQPLGRQSNLPNKARIDANSSRAVSLPNSAGNYISEEAAEPEPIVQSQAMRYIRRLRSHADLGEQVQELRQPQVPIPSTLKPPHKLRIERGENSTQGIEVGFPPPSSSSDMCETTSNENNQHNKRVSFASGKKSSNEIQTKKQIN